MKFYCEIESEHSVFEVREGCCYRQIIYSGDVAVLERVDGGYGTGLTSADLVCMCHPRLIIKRISRVLYEQKLMEVNEQQRKRVQN